MSRAFQSTSILGQDLRDFASLLAFWHGSLTQISLLSEMTMRGELHTVADASVASEADAINRCRHVDICAAGMHVADSGGVLTIMTALQCM